MLVNLPGASGSEVIEPFFPSLYNHSSGPSAFPPSRSEGFMPLKIYYSWTNETFDDAIHVAIRESSRHLRQLSGASEAFIYPNYAIYDTLLELIYEANLSRLRKLKRCVDLGNVMGLAGGFKFDICTLGRCSVKLTRHLTAVTVETE